MKKNFYLLFILSFLVSTVISPLITNDVNAANKSDWSAGKIIDDGIFYNSGDMTVQQIQSFLNSKVPVCDTWGTQQSELGGGTRAQYGASRGYPAPFTCLKDYYENPSTRENNLSGRQIPTGAISSAQLIKNAAVTYGVSVRALLVLIQKESPGPLLTDTWPFPNQFRNAMGYGCPDTAPCDPQYDGFNNQVSNAARQFKLYKNNPSGYRYKPQQYNTISYQANAPSCGTSSVFIETYGTAGLYNYTPYQPNQAALNNMYGTGDSCSAYGNRNFWRMFIDWFGPTVNSSLSYSLVKGPDSPAVYLQASNRKYYIPTQAVMTAWGINNLTVQQVSQSYIDSLSTGPWVGNLLKDDWNNYSIVEGGKLHYVRDTSYLGLWNLNSADAVQSLGLSYALPSGDWVGRFVKDGSQPNGPSWLIDKGGKHLITDISMMYHWRYTADQLTNVSTAFLDSIPTSTSNVTPYATSTSGNYVIDTGKKLKLGNDNVKTSFYGATAPVSYDDHTLSYLETTEASQFVINSATGQWFMLEGGRRHYITSAASAELWGKKSNSPLTSLSSDFINRLSDAGELSHIIQTSSPSAYWLIDGSKRYIADAATSAAWIGNGALPTYSNESVSLLPQGSNATNIINVAGSPYTYMLIDGTKHYLKSDSVKDAWGGTVIQISPQLINKIPEGVFLDYKVKDQNNNAYLLMSGKKYPIDNSFKPAWGIDDSTIKIDSAVLSNYTNGAALKGFVKIDNRSYAITDKGSKTPLSRYSDAFRSNTLGEVSLPSDYFSTTREASYLVKSIDTADTRVWLINQGKKTLIDFTQQVSLGYLSAGINPTALSPATLSIIPDDTVQFSLMVQKQGSGIKLLNFGSALGFPDGPTLFSYVPPAGILLVADSIFDSIPLIGNASRVITDDQGKYFLVENGKRRWITNSAAYVPYSSLQRVYLYGITMALIPEGAPLN